MARKRVQQYYDKNRKVYVGYFYIDGKRAVKRDLFSDNDLNFKTTKAGIRKKRTEDEKVNFFNYVYNDISLKLLKELDKKKATVVNSSTVKALSDEWLGTIHKEATKKSYKYTIVYYLQSSGNYYIDLHEVTFISKFKSFLTEKGQSENTINKHLRELRAFFNWVNYNGKSNKIIKFKIESVTAEDIEVYSQLEKIELENVILGKIDKANTDYRKMMFHNDYRAFIMAKYTGLRRGELMYLTLENICLETKVVKVRKNDEFDWNPKEKKIRDIPISEKLNEFLIADINSRSTGERYFLDNGKGKPYLDTLDRMTARIRKHCQETGIRERKPKLKPIHSMRSTLLTELDSSGASPFQMQKIAGHSDLSTTQRYVSEDKDQQREALNNIT